MLKMGALFFPQNKAPLDLPESGSPPGSERMKIEEAPPGTPAGASSRNIFRMEK